MALTGFPQLPHILGIIHLGSLGGTTFATYGGCDAAATFLTKSTGISLHAVAKSFEGLFFYIFSL